jgi:hypothetical protein
MPCTITARRGRSTIEKNSGVMPVDSTVAQPIGNIQQLNGSPITRRYSVVCGMMAALRRRRKLL